MQKFLFFFFLFTVVFSSCLGENVCSQPLETGPCKAKMTRYGYAKWAGKCVKFTYGGCGGNDNNFEYVEQCRAVCETSWTTDGYTE